MVSHILINEALLILFVLFDVNLVAMVFIFNYYNDSSALKCITIFCILRNFFSYLSRRQHTRI